MFSIHRIALVAGLLPLSSLGEILVPQKVSRNLPPQEASTVTFYDDAGISKSVIQIRNTSFIST